MGPEGLVLGRDQISQSVLTRADHALDTFNRTSFRLPMIAFPPFTERASKVDGLLCYLASIGSQLDQMCNTALSDH